MATHQAISESSKHGAAPLAEAFRIAVDSIWTHKLRSVLTLLGIIISIASVVAVGGAIVGVGSYLSDSMSSMLASNTFLVAQFSGPMSMKDYDEKLKRNKKITAADMRSVEEKCDTCDAVSPRMGATANAKRGNQTFYDASITGVNSDFAKIQSIDLAEGRFITNSDVTHARPFAVIGSQIRDELFGPVEALGKELKLGGESFTVIGVEVHNGTLMGQSMDNNIYIPYTAFLKQYGSRQSIEFKVSAPTEAAFGDAQDEVRQIMRARHKLRPKNEDDFDILASNAVQDFIGELTGTIALVITPITLISLVVGGIVVMNIMLVTVTERTVEIGMRKAVGARQSDILLQFLVESAILASLGGAIGIVIAYMVSLIIQGTTPVPMQISAGYILIAIVTSGGVGLVSGIYPAYKASRLDPIVALMRE